jgi:pyridoxal phosphate enzyme (YggS family)
MTQTSIQENLSRVRERISRAASRVGRHPNEIALIAVSKTRPASAIRDAFEAGVRHFGENRVQEWEGKHAATEGLAATWHLIGHLQSNKAARAARLFHSVDSVDDLALAQRLDRARGEAGIIGKLRVLIEVRVAQEETKSGVEIAQLPALAETVAELPHLQLAGLMCIPPFFDPQSTVISSEARNPSSLASVDARLQTTLTEEGHRSSPSSHPVRPYFRRLRELRDNLTKRFGFDLPVLSMGMSHDFEVAIEEGATEVRIGTALFGPRA